MDAYDLDAYFSRIGHGGSTAPRLDTLAALHRAHTRAIAFENLNPLLDIPVGLDPASLQRKLVQGQRGGYCFEHNLLLSGVLQQLGFRVTQLAARVLWGAPDDAQRARTHMLLRIDVEGESFLIDGGFGGMTLPSPIRLDVEGPQTTTHEPYRLLRRGDDIFMQAEVAGEWRTLYRFDLQPHFLPDYEIVNGYYCYHPDSHFKQRLSVGRAVDGGRDALANNVLTRHRLGAESTKRVLGSASELRDALEDVFELRVPQVPQLHERLQRIAEMEVPA